MKLRYFLPFWMFILFGTDALAQTNQVWLPGSTPTNTVVARNNLFALGSLAPGTQDTTGGVSMLVPGAMRLRPQDSLIYVFNGRITGKKWNVIGTVGTVTSVNGQTGTVTLSIPTNTNQLVNGNGFITSAGAPVQSVNGLVGAVTIDGSIVHLGGDSHLGVSGAGTGLSPYLISFNRTNFDTLNGRKVDTGSIAHQGYVVSYDSVNKKYVLVPQSGGAGAGVTSFNTRSGTVVLISADVVAALGFTPLNPANNLNDLSSASAGRANLGLGTSATHDVPASGNASSTQVVLGNDTRLPTSVVNSFNTRTGAISLTGTDVTTALTFTPENIANKGVASGYPGLDGNARVPYGTIQNVTSNRLLGRFAGTNGIIQELTLGTHMTLNQLTGLLDVNATIPEGIVGKLYGAGSWTNLNQFTDHGPSGATASGGKIVFTGGTSDFVRSLDLDSLIGRNGFTDLKNLSVYVRVITGTKTATNTFGIGLRSQVSALTSDALAQFDATNTGSSGKLNFCALTTSVTSVVSSSSGSVAFTAGDKIGLTFQINGKVVTLYARNETTSSNTVVLSFAYTFNVGDLPAYPNMGKLAIFNSSGSGDGFSVDSLSVYSSAVTFPSILFVTDSKGSLYSSDLSLSYPELLKSIYGSTIYSGGSSEAATDAFARLPEFLNTIHPRAVVLSVGRNAGSTDTLTAYKPLVDSLTAHGIQVYHLIEGADATWTVGPQFVAFINGHYAPNTIMDGYTMVANHPEYLASDLVHYSVLGHQAFANLVLSANLLQKGTYTDGLIGEGLAGQVPYWTSLRGLTGSPAMLYDDLSGTLTLNKNRNGYTKIVVGNANPGVTAVASLGTLANDLGNTWEMDNISSGGGVYGGFGPNMLGIYSTHPITCIMNDRPNAEFRVCEGVGGVTSSFSVFQGQAGLGTTASSPAASAALDISSTTRGLLMPRMTTTQRNAISSPATGLIVYNTTVDSFQYHPSSGGWQNLGAGSSGPDTLKVVPTPGNLGVLIGSTNNKDTIVLDRFVGPKSVQLTKNSDSSVTVTLVNDTIPVASYTYGANAAGRLGFYQAPVSGTFVSTLTNTTNISAATLTQATYSRVGNVVHVTIGGTFIPTLTATNSVMTFSLPINTATTTQGSVGSGTIAYNGGNLGYFGAVVNIASASTGVLNFFPTVTAGSTATFSFSLDYTL